MIIDALKTISYQRLTKIGFILFGTILAPFMFIFEFARHIFDQNSIIPLLFISACVGLPVALVIFVLRVLDDAGLDPDDPKEKLTTRFGQMATSSLASGLSFYLPCCIKFFQPDLSLRDSVNYMVPFLFVIGINSIFSIARGGSKAFQERMAKHLKETSKDKK